MKKRFLLTSVLMLLLTLLAVSTSTYAWFTMSSDVYVNEFNVTAVQTTGGMDISTDGSSWATNRKVTVTTNNPAFDLTADADSKIYQRNNDSNLTEATENRYNTFYLYFKTTSYGKIQLKLNESYIVPSAYATFVKDGGAFVNNETFVTNALAHEQGLDPSAISNKSTSGDFTRDWIAAAFRMSFKVVSFQSGTTPNYTLSENTLPASYTNAPGFVKSLDKVSLSQNSLTGKYSIESDGEGSNVYGVGPGATEGTYALTSSAAYTAKDFLTDDSLTICEISNAGLPFTTGNTYIVKVEVKVWIEGQDNEAVLPLTGGIVTSALKFDLDKTGVSDPTDYRTAVAFTNLSGSAEGLTFNAPSAAITGNNISVFAGSIADLGITGTADQTYPTVAALATIDKTASAYVPVNPLAAGTYTIIAPVTVSTNIAIGYKAVTNYFVSEGVTYIYAQFTVAE